MPILKPDTIKQIVKDLDAGYQCYVHKKTTELISIDLTLEDSDKVEAQKIQKETMDRKEETYLKIESISTKDSLVIMRDFIEEVSDRSIQKQLSNALNRKNPVRNFTQVVQSDMELNQHWTNYKSKEYQRWVSNFVIDAYN